MAVTAIWSVKGSVKGSSLCCEPGKDMERTVCGGGKVPHGGEDIGV